MQISSKLKVTAFGASSTDQVSFKLILCREKLRKVFFGKAHYASNISSHVNVNVMYNILLILNYFAVTRPTNISSGHLTNGRLFREVSTNNNLVEH